MAVNERLFVGLSSKMVESQCGTEKESTSSRKKQHIAPTNRFTQSHRNNHVRLSHNFFKNVILYANFNIKSLLFLKKIQIHAPSENTNDFHINGRNIKS